MSQWRSHGSLRGNISTGKNERKKGLLKRQQKPRKGWKSYIWIINLLYYSRWWKLSSSQMFSVGAWRQTGEAPFCFKGQSWDFWAQQRFWSKTAEFSSALLAAAAVAFRFTTFSGKEPREAGGFITESSLRTSCREQNQAWSFFRTTQTGKHLEP